MYSQIIHTCTHKMSVVFWLSSSLFHMELGEPGHNSIILSQIMYVEIVHTLHGVLLEFQIPVLPPCNLERESYWLKIFHCKILWSRY